MGFDSPDDQSPPKRKPRASARNGARTVDEAALYALRDALKALGSGDFSVRLPVASGTNGVVDEIAQAFNAVGELNLHLADEAVRVRRLVGREGLLGERASL